MLTIAMLMVVVISTAAFYKIQNKGAKIILILSGAALIAPVVVSCCGHKITITDDFLFLFGCSILLGTGIGLEARHWLINNSHKCKAIINRLLIIASMTAISYRNSGFFSGSRELYLLPAFCTIPFLLAIIETTRISAGRGSKHKRELFLVCAISCLIGLVLGVALFYIRHS